MAVMRILGIDPGTRVVGYACLEVQLSERAAISPFERPLAQRAANLVTRSAPQGKAGLLEAGSLELGGPKSSLPLRLQSLAEQLEGLIGRFSPSELALEEAFFGKSIQSALRIGESRGVVMAIAGRLGLSVHQYSPAKIKRAVTGRGSADKDAVASMAGHLLGLRITGGSYDASDAIAVALCRLEDRRSLITGR